MLTVDSLLSPDVRIMRGPTVEYDLRVRVEYLAPDVDLFELVAPHRYGHAEGWMDRIKREVDRIAAEAEATLWGNDVVMAGGVA